MHLSALAKACILGSIIGLVVLLIAAKMGSESTRLLLPRDGQDVMVQGEVESIRLYDSTAAIVVRHDAYTKVIVFDNITDASLRKGDWVRIFGQKSQENDEEVIADRIEVKDIS